MGKDAHTEEHVVGYYNAGDRMQFLGHTGGLLGLVGGLLVGGALFVIQGLVPSSYSAAGGRARGERWEGRWWWARLSAGRGLYSIGIPQDSIVEYETALKSAQFLVMARDTDEEVATAMILETTGAAYIAAHQGVSVAAANHNGSGRQSM